MAMNWNKKGCESGNGVWITQIDEKLKIKDMRTDHIRNCILYIETYGGELRRSETDKIDELEKELFKRKELGVLDE